MLIIFLLISGAIVCPTAVKLPFPRAACYCAVCVVCLNKRTPKMADSTSASPIWSWVCTGARCPILHGLFLLSCVQSPSFPNASRFIHPVNHNEVSRPPRSLPGVRQTRLNISELISTVVTPPPPTTVMSAPLS